MTLFPKQLFKLFPEQLFKRRSGPRVTVDWKHTPTERVLTLEVEGKELRKEDVKVEIENNYYYSCKVLYISVDHLGQSKREEKTDTWWDRWLRMHHMERGRHTKDFWLSGDLIAEQAQAAVENGVLTVKIPKWYAPKNSVEVSG